MLRKLATRLGQNKHRAWRSGIASAETDEAPPIACCHGHRGMTWMAGCGSHPSSNRNRSAARYFRRFVPIASADAHERYWLGGILTAVRGLVTPKTVYNRREFTHRRLLGTQAPRHVGGGRNTPRCTQQTLKILALGYWTPRAKYGPPPKLWATKKPEAEPLDARLTPRRCLRS